MVEMSSDEEVDYMSDAFLKSVCGKQDIRPGLFKSYAQKYDHERAVKRFKSEENNRISNPSLKVKEAVNREDGLNKPITSDNVGFKMMEKLGFKPGSGLGKSGEGRVDPIAVEVKTNRQGLGRQSSLKEIAEMRSRYKREARERLLDVNDYRARKAEEVAEKRALIDLIKSQKICWELDSKDFIDEPAESWFWPKNRLPDDNEDDEEVVDDIEDESDRQHLDKEEEKDEDDYDEDTEETNEADPDDEVSVREKLEMLTLYLRRTYLYCIWCGHSYDDEKDLQQDCPGPTGEDH